jgi:hypothetical protein
MSRGNLNIFACFPLATSNDQVKEQKSIYIEMSEPNYLGSADIMMCIKPYLQYFSYKHILHYFDCDSMHSPLLGLLICACHPHRSLEGLGSKIPRK